MSDLPRRTVTRTAKLATLPLSFAGRTALGLGKRTLGKPAELVAQEIQNRTAEQLFKVLGELKGGAMKVGQVMSIFEAALPPDVAKPFRASLTRLQAAAPPMPTSTVHQVMAEDLGAGWRDSFAEFDTRPAAAASIGQVHKAVWHDGRTVAVKIQYPGAGKALMSDFNQLARVGRLGSALFPGLEIKPLLAELRSRLSSELDYAAEAAAQESFRAGFADDPDYLIPAVVAQSEHVLVSEWIDGTPLSKLIDNDEVSQPERDRVALLYFRFLLSGPARCGLVHIDPHPGNFLVLDDGRLGVLDFGGASPVSPEFLHTFGTLSRIANTLSGEEMLRAARQHGFLREGFDVDPAELEAVVAPVVLPTRSETFHYSREWLRSEAARGLGLLTDLRPNNVLRQVNAPPEYLPLSRTLGLAAGVMSQLDAEVPVRGEVIRWVPGFLDDDDEAPAIA
jgi:predicted unusual protein kinase regulating ubiquinone biosynthesis (AarF/ABC1/UbiB family)